MRPAMEDAVRLLLSTSPGPFGAPDPSSQLLASAITGANFGFTSRTLTSDIQLAFTVTPRDWLQHATWRYFTSPGGVEEGVPFLSTASSVFSDYRNSTDHGVCADAVLTVAIGNIELN